MFNGLSPVANHQHFLPLRQGYRSCHWDYQLSSVRVRMRDKEKAEIPAQGRQNAITIYGLRSRAESLELINRFLKHPVRMLWEISESFYLKTPQGTFVKETDHEEMTQSFLVFFFFVLRFAGTIGNKMSILTGLIFVCLWEIELNASGVFPQTCYNSQEGDKAGEMIRVHICFQRARLPIVGSPPPPLYNSDNSPAWMSSLLSCQFHEAALGCLTRPQVADQNQFHQTSVNT